MNNKICFPPAHALNDVVKNAPSSVVPAVLAVVVISSAVIVLAPTKFGVIVAPNVPVEYAIRTLWI